MTQTKMTNRANSAITAIDGGAGLIEENAAAVRLAHLETAEQLRSAFPVMQQLRPHLQSETDMVARIQRMRQSDGYRLLAAERGGQVLALAGYRIQENLIYGRFLYVDDLITLDTARSARLGARLLDEAKAIARSQHCNRLVLDTGLANCLAQRFYFRQGLLSTALHFSEILTPA